jgi:hypothetical protein
MLPSCVNSVPALPQPSEDVYSESPIPMTKAEEQALLARLDSLEKSSKSFHFKKFVHDWWGPFASILALIAALIAGLHFLVQPDIASVTTDVKGIHDDITRIDGSIKDTNQKIDTLLNKALDRAWQATIPTAPNATPSTGKNKNTRGAIELGNSVVETANQLNLPLDKSVPYGQNLLLLADSDSDLRAVAWRGANLVLGQQSLKNISFVPTPQPTTDVRIRTIQSVWTLPGPVLGEITSMGALLPRPQGAFSDKFEELYPKGKDHIQIHAVQQDLEPEFILVQRADAVLDEFHLRRIIYKDSHIVYNGGRVDIRLVYFENCSFDIAPTEQGALFSKALLKNVPMSFSNSSDK